MSLKLPNRLRYLLFAASATAGTVSGLVYGYFLYFCESHDPYSVVNHPLQPLFRTLHVVTVPAMAMMLAVFWIAHAWPYIQADHRRGLRTGLVLGLTSLPMIFSGYFLQVSVAELWTQFWMWLHIGSSVGWILGIIFHVVTHRRRRSPARTPSDG